MAINKKYEVRADLSVRGVIVVEADSMVAARMKAQKLFDGRTVSEGIAILDKVEFENKFVPVSWVKIVRK